MFSVTMPIMTLAVFGGIFIMANPDLVKSVTTTLIQFAEAIQNWLQHFQFTEVLFCFAAFWVGAGALRPVLPEFRVVDSFVTLPNLMARSPYYAACRNTL